MPTLTPIARTAGPALFALEPTVFPRQCVKRVSDLTHGWAEDDIVNLMNVQCFSPHVQKRHGTSPALSIAICGRPLAWRVPIASLGVFGCSLD